VPARLPGEFPYLPGQSGYDKRLRAAMPLLKHAIRMVAADTAGLWHGGTWIVDSTPMECGRSRPTAQRSELAGWAGYGYRPSHSRFFWGLRLHLICTAGQLYPARPGLCLTFSDTLPALGDRFACSRNSTLFFGKPRFVSLVENSNIQAALIPAELKLLGY
jgi:hypothetical protein